MVCCPCTCHCKSTQQKTDRWGSRHILIGLVADDAVSETVDGAVDGTVSETVGEAVSETVGETDGEAATDSQVTE